MSYRSDVNVDWSSSPRIITVASPSVEITMQDLYDTLRVLEVAQMDEDAIVAGAGKESLGGGVLVGLTITLLNAQLAFEARSGPDYVQCRISGGNLVAIDDTGADISSIYPTAFTQIILANSSSATLTEQAAIQYASYDGGVSYDESNGVVGTDYPIGTPQSPVNNPYDAYTIASEVGLRRVYVYNTINVPTDLLLENFTFVGVGVAEATATIPEAATVGDCTFNDITIIGYLDGENTIRDCQLGDGVNDVYYIQGIIESCLLSPGTITLSGEGVAHFLDCWSGQPGLGTPTIDMGGSGQALALRNYNGGIKIINKSGPESVSIDMNSGQVILDDTVTAGTIVLRGIGTWTNKNTYAGGANVVNQLIEGEYVQALGSGTFGGSISVLTTSGNSGSDFPIGTNQYPVDNLVDAHDISNQYGLSSFKLLDNQSIPLGIDFTSHEFTSDAPTVVTVSVPSGAQVDDCNFRDIIVTGTMSGSTNFERCQLVNITDLDGIILNSGLLGTITLASGTHTSILDSWPVSNDVIPTTTIIDLNGDATLSMHNVSGNFVLRNKTSSDTIYLHFSGGEFEIDDTVTGGRVVITGVGVWKNADTYAGGAEIDTDYIDAEKINDLHVAHFNKRVWDQTENTITLYAEDGTTPLFIFDTNEDMSIIVPRALESNVTYNGDNVVSGSDNVVVVV